MYKHKTDFVLHAHPLLLILMNGNKNLRVHPPSRLHLFEAKFQRHMSELWKHWAQGLITARKSPQCFFFFSFRLYS